MTYIKSYNHELPLDSYATLYQRCYKANVSFAVDWNISFFQVDTANSDMENNLLACQGIDDTGCVSGHSIMLFASVKKVTESGRLEFDHFTGKEWIYAGLDIAIPLTEGKGTDVDAVMRYLFGKFNLVLAYHQVCHNSACREANLSELVLCLVERSMHPEILPNLQSAINRYRLTRKRV